MMNRAVTLLAFLALSVATAAVLCLLAGVRG